MLNKHLTSFSCVRLGMNLRICIKKTCVERDWTMHSKFVNYSRLDSQQTRGDLYDHLIIHKIFVLTTNQNFCTSFENYEESECMRNLDLLIISH